MDYLQQIQRGVDFIERELDGDLQLHEVARLSGMSQWHFQRIFRALTGETLKSYIRSRRFGRAVERLRTTDWRILDIALAAGYESHESFSRAFKKAFAVTPQEYRQTLSKQLVPRRLPLDELQLSHLRCSLSLIPRIERRPELRFVGLRTEFYSVDSDKNNIGKKLPPLWDEFMSRLAEVPHAVRGICYGVVRPISERGEMLEYFAAVEVSAQGPCPPRMESFSLPASDYAVFTHSGDATTIDRTVDYIYSAWLLQSPRAHSGAADLEIYGKEWNPGSPDCRFEYAIPLGPSSTTQ